MEKVSVLLQPKGPQNGPYSRIVPTHPSPRTKNVRYHPVTIFPDRSIGNDWKTRREIPCTTYVQKGDRAEGAPEWPI